MRDEVSNEVAHDRQRAQVILSTDRVVNGEENMIDQEARDVANKADSRIESHERLCTERWEQSRAGQQRVEASLATMADAMNDRIGKLPAGLIALLTGLCGFLGARAFPIH